jgi:hypothetical protein
MERKGSWNDGIRNSLDNRGTEGKRKVNRSGRNFSRYFEDYSVNVVRNEKGRARVERLYTGAYYRQDLTVFLQILLRIAYIGLLAFAAVLFGSNAVQDYSCNFLWYFVLP